VITDDLVYCKITSCGRVNVSKEKKGGGDGDGGREDGGND
jgi:hypothetical protein